MRKVTFGFGLALGLMPALTAHATPIPRYEDLVTRRSLRASAKLPKALSTPLYQSTEVKKIDTQLDLVPSSGVATGHVDVELHAVGSVGQVALLLDSGLAATGASAPGKTVDVANQVAQGYAFVNLTLTPAMAPGETVTIAVDYSGTLSCQSQGCYAGAPLSFISENAAIPGVFDQDNVGGYNAWGASRSLTLSVPEGIDAVASGELASSSTAGGKTTRVWKIPAFHSYGGNVVMLGVLADQPVTGVSIPTRVVSTQVGPSHVSEMVGFMQKILPFVDAQAGQKLPYAELKVFKLPLGWLDIFRGTAGYGLTLLSEDYAAGSVAYFEETLAHENAHQWWGVLVSPTDIPVTRWLVEGMATLSQIDYAAQVQHADVPRDEYLARRYREHWMLVKHLGDPSLPLVVDQTNQIPEDSIANTLWAYIRSSAFLEYLRVVAGDDVFAKLLRTWAQTCNQKLCDTGDFENLLEAESGQDFGPVFAQWVYSGTAAEPSLAFSQSGGTLSVTASGIDGLSVPLELFVEGEGGKLEKRKVVFEGSAPVTLAIPTPVRRVRPNPRQDGLIWSRSATPGDRDFDGEVDGFDVIQCAYRLGREAAPSQTGGEGIWSSDLDFDPRCDEDQNGSISDADLSAVSAAFGNVKGGQ